MRKLLFLFTGMTMAMLLVAMPGIAQNVTLDPGFENTTVPYFPGDPWYLTFAQGAWADIPAVLDSAVFHSGAKSVSFTGNPALAPYNQGDIAQWTALNPDGSALTADTTYEISVWTKANGLSMGMEPQILYTFCNFASPQMWEPHEMNGILGYASGTWDWRKSSDTMVCPAGATHAYIRVVLLDYHKEAQNNTGTIWFDDVSIAPYVAPTTATIQGNINLQDYSGDKTTVPVTVNLNGTDITTYVDADGNFSISDVAYGNYTIHVKAAHWLAKAITVDVSGDTDLGIVSLMNGDCNGDNGVGFSDFNMIKSAWATTPGASKWNDNADLNGDGGVGFSDFNIIKKNWAKTGDS